MSKYKNGVIYIKIIRHIVMMGCVLTLSSCAIGPDYSRPSVNVPITFKEAKKNHAITKEYRETYWKKAAPRDLFYRGEWWKIFQDATLNSLENQLNQSNQTIAVAYQNYRQARALVAEARAAYFPTLSGSVDFTRQKVNARSSSNNTGGTATTTSSNTQVAATGLNDNYLWLLSASWEPDIWGLVRRTVEAASANAEANAALLAATRLSTQASLAQFYFECRGLDQDQRLLDQTVKDYKKALQLTKNQYASGVVSRADILQAQSQLDTAKAAAINNGILRAQYEHAIAILIGVPPATFSLKPSTWHAKIPRIPVTIPSLLLERRPDIAQAERLVAQANAKIGVAETAFFPALTLSGTASTITKKLFHFPFLNWSLSAQMADVIFDGGLRSATVEAAWASYCASVASYRQTVLAAFQNVEDNLSALRLLENQAIFVNQAAANAKAALKLVINQYRAGTVDYASVLTAQISAYAAQKQADDLTYIRLTTAVALIAALGGGWDASLIQDAAT